MSKLARERRVRPREGRKKGIAGHRKGMCKAWETGKGRAGSEGQRVCWDGGEASRGRGVELGPPKQRTEEKETGPPRSLHTGCRTSGLPQGHKAHRNQPAYFEGEETFQINSVHPCPDRWG